ncbi:hypothetical protein [Streptomyces cahuitamycinicus]|uniref:hypothetical protein n=1 Tax=Streptomyces cahuitamycinicus TaxID=2070367 RepID=UPI0015E11C28|nr:hypothetical protein [Streptomyces cahuitamycinicus]
MAPLRPALAGSIGMHGRSLGMRKRVGLSEPAEATMSRERGGIRQAAEQVTDAVRSLSLFHPVLEGEMGWSAGVVTRQGPSSLVW